MHTHSKMKQVLENVDPFKLHFSAMDHEETGAPRNVATIPTQDPLLLWCAKNGWWIIAWKLRHIIFIKTHFHITKF